MASLEKKLEKLEKLLNVANEDYASTKEVAQLFAELISKYNDLDDTITRKVDSIRSQIIAIIEENDLYSKSFGKELRGELSKLKDSFATQEYVNRLITSVEEISKNASLDAIQEVKKSIPKRQSIHDIRNGLEDLEGDDRLNKSAIGGLDRFIEKEDLDRAIDILDKRTQYLINKTTTQSNSGGGFTTLAPTETPDGSRTLFTFPAATGQLSFIVSDNALTRATSKTGTVNWTWNDSTKQAAMTIPPADDLIGIQ